MPTNWQRFELGFYLYRQLLLEDQMTTLTSKRYRIHDCPHCQKGAVFSGIFSMHTHCGVCGYRFSREQGYFIGAMVFSYFIGSLLGIFLLLVGTFILHFNIVWVAVFASLMVSLLAPLLFRYSRLLWIRMDYRADSVEK